MEQRYLKIINGRVLTPEGITKDKQVLIAEGKIIDLPDTNTEVPDARVIDAQGNYVAPGFIDMHIHGGGGHDFTEATSEAFRSIAEAHARYGTTSMYATLCASSNETIYQAITACEQVMNEPAARGARILGLHLEGNYLNMTMRGGQDPAYILLPDPGEYRAIAERSNCLKRWSAAPELEGALAFGRYVSDKGILVALAHTTADYNQVKDGFEAGFTHATHFYNAMTGVHKDREYKHEGTIESIYLIDDMTVEVVADGIHVPPAILRLVHKVKGTCRTALITDAMSVSACLDRTQPYDKRMIVENGVCKLSDRSALAGSIATADRLIRTFVQQVGIPLHDVVRMASETPARIMGILDRKGTIEKGKDADIIIFDEDIRIKTTIIEGIPLD